MIIINFAEGHSQTLQMMYILLGKDPVNHSAPGNKNEIWTFSLKNIGFSICCHSNE